MKKNYCYGILIENTPDKYLHAERTYLDSPWKKSKYALIEKQCFKDHSEGINRIIYSNDLDFMVNLLIKYVSWYDYITGKMKNIQQYISTIYN